MSGLQTALCKTMALRGQYEIAVPALPRGRYLLALPMVIFLAAIIHILRPPGLYEYPLTAWYSHRSAEERGRVQLRSVSPAPRQCQRQPQRRRQQPTSLPYSRARTFGHLA